MALGVVGTLFAGRLIQLQAVDGPVYAAQADVTENRFVKVVLPAERGAITDRNGNVLADTVDAYDITADPSMFTPSQAKVADGPARAAALLAPVLGVDAGTLERKLSAKGRYAMLAAQVSPAARQQVLKLKNSNPVLAGVFDSEHSKRVYPAGDLAGNLLGFVSADGKGTGGLEGEYDPLLRGHDGKRTYVQVGGRRVPTAGGKEDPAVPGRDVRLTLDRDLQWTAQQAIADKVRETGADSGSVVAIDVKTGQVLAMASAPGYDPGDLSKVTSRQLAFPALQEAFEPGSTSKVMSMSAVIQEHAAEPGTHVTVPGTLQRADRVFHDDVPHGDWHLTLTGVLAKSSNIGTILATEQLGKNRTQINDTLYSYLRRFGIGQPSGIGYPGETRGILAKPQDWNASQQYTIPFGQGVSMNALQATSVYATVANGGVRVTPTLVAGTTGADGRFTPSPAPKETRAISASTAGTVSDMLEAVVGNDGGTGTYARIPGYRVAGKTGTANRPNPNGPGYSGYTASFIGYAPADKPRIAIGCFLQGPHKTGHFGGPLCGPVFKKVAEEALTEMNVAPSGSPSPNLPINW
ncbi:cell division protein [Mangrovactinospora gilvigrisea]|uniref:Cell division protein n=1 Tax=Mangrovactinospora gilvigrisea TaxID=1428644 RepID=A0A1J7BHW3_9ACTN|nr:cell division protein [Mangrovactinospora gilvigrisea]